jgi:phosphohistidine phosphatase
MAPFELYLVRHGLAGVREAGKDDALRPLTKRGAHRTRAVARRLLGADIHFDTVLTSPLLRARQTADILHAVGLGPQPAVFASLAPGGTLERFLRFLASRPHKRGRRLALVGHMPDLAAWAERLVAGSARGHLVLKKAGVIGLTLPLTGGPLGRSSLFLLVPPRVLL